LQTNITEATVKPPYFALPLLVLLAFIVYAPAISGSFMVDDTIRISKNKTEFEAGLIPTLKSTWKNKFQTPDRPLMMTSIWLNYKIHKLDTRGYKMTNILFHGLASFSVLWLFLILSQKHPELFSRKIAYGLAILFTVHRRQGPYLFLRRPGDQGHVQEGPQFP